MSDTADRIYGLDRSAVRRSFNRASASYDQAAVLQTEVRARLLSRLDLVTLDPRAVLDLGAGTGHASRELLRRYPRAQVIALDLAEGMLVASNRRQGWLRRFRRVCADALRLPLRDAAVDLVFSNLMLQWCAELHQVLAEVRRILRPGGLFTFTTFGPDTLRELRAAWQAADEYTHVNRFIDMHDIGDALVRADLAEPVLDVERYTLTYDDVRGLMRDLKTIGAHNVNAGRARGLTGRGRFEAMLAAYESWRSDGRLPASYEVVFGQAWGPLVARHPTSAAGEVRIPIGSIGLRRGQEGGGGQ
ncbi:MAG TPA: malonyl-ACP O-methyltransferase BioC [Gammaproteobacteria bacterium]|nr:malonyl-ACP O-methyltransferase BioC [Gammaproteobacteria bacterium]